jgi:hypothetical protein
VQPHLGAGEEVLWRQVELEVRFTGVRDPRAVVEIANRAARPG